jgi:hypothetical protein
MNQVDLPMKNMIFRIGILFLMLIVIACPAQAFTAKNLDIAIQANTDAIITFDYDLTWYENVAVFSRIADPGNELAKALRSQSGKNVEVLTVSGNHAQFLVENFASGTDKNGTITMIAPALSFTNARKALDTYWFGRFISPDFSPDITRISFPDGYAEEFYNQDQIPAVGHTMVTPG